MVQLTDELQDCGQPNAAERTFELNHGFELAEALVRNAKSGPRRASG
jgi:hypothetical protein